MTFGGFIGAYYGMKVMDKMTGEDRPYYKRKKKKRKRKKTNTKTTRGTTKKMAKRKKRKKRRERHTDVTYNFGILNG